MIKTFQDNAAIRFTVNGVAQELLAPLDATLQEVLHHKLKHRDVRYGCGEGVCGACSVLVDGEPLASCLLLAVMADGKEVVTASGLELHSGFNLDQVRRLREHLLADEAFQCGYCACGMFVSAANYVNVTAAYNDFGIRQAISGNLCRCTGYAPIVEAVRKTCAHEVPAPDNYPREDLVGRLDGTARYPTDGFDMEFLHGAVHWSQYAYARVMEIDVTAAEQMPGVVKVLKGDDIPDEGKNVSGNNLFGIDNGQPVLVRPSNYVRSMGDALALVVAESQTIARAAAAAIKAHYHPLPPMNDLAIAAQDASRQIAKFYEVRGDAEAAFDRPGVQVVEGVYSCTINDHACMEAEGGSGWYEGNTLVLHVPTQTPHTARLAVARLLGIPEQLVRIQCERMGGSFGKYLMTNTECYLALMVNALQRPVRLVLNRIDGLKRTPKRHPFRGEYKLGVDSQHKLVALRARLYADAGAYVGLTPTVVALFAVESAGAYEIPNVDVQAYGVLTNNVVTAPMRGFGSQQVAFGIESLIDKAARFLHIDPADLRKKNFRRTQRIDGKGQETRDPVTSEWLGKALVEVQTRMGPKPQPPEGWLVGRGFASIHAKYGYPSGLMDRFVVKLTVRNDGRFAIEADSSDAGTGFSAGIPRIIARLLNLHQVPEYNASPTALNDPTGVTWGKKRSPTAGEIESFQRIEAEQLKGVETVRDPDGLLLQCLRRWSWFPGFGNIINFQNRSYAKKKTAHFPLAVDSYLPRVSGSRSLLMLGRAAERAVTALLNTVSERLGGSVFATSNGHVALQSNPKQLWTWTELAAMFPAGEIQSIGSWELPQRDFMVQETLSQIGPLSYMLGAHGCDLFVQPKTGEVQIAKFVACHDVGRVLDEKIIRGQILGGITMGLAQALFEHIQLTKNKPNQAENGRIETDNFHKYCVPSSLDVPTAVEIVLLESGEGLGPRGTRGIGEAGAVGSPCAIANAIYDATGSQLVEISTTWERISELART